MKFSILIIAIFLTVSCTKSEKQVEQKDKNKTQAIIFDSAFNFEYDPKLVKSENFVVAGDHKFTKEQLFRSEKALPEMEKKSQELMLVTAYKMAIQSLQDKDKKSAKITLPASEEPLDVEQILSKYGLETNPDVILDQSESLDSHSVKVDNKIISESELAKTNLNFAENRQKIFHLTMKRIEERVARFLVTEESKKAGMDINRYVDEKISNGQKLTNEDVKQFGVENNVPESSIDEEMLNRLRLIIETKGKSEKMVTHAAELMGDKKIKVAIRRPALELEAPDNNLEAPHWGNGKMQISLVSNFLCQQCRTLENNINSIIDKYKERIQLIYIFNFKPENREMRMVAEAALCTHEMASDKFWDFRDHALTEDFDASEEKINATVETIGLSLAEFRKCFLARKTKETLESQLQAINDLGHLRAPTLLIEDQVIAGDLSSESLEQSIQEALKSYGSSLSMKGKRGGFWAWLKGLFS